MTAEEQNIYAEEQIYAVFGPSPSYNRELEQLRSPRLRQPAQAEQKISLPDEVNESGRMMENPSGQFVRHESLPFNQSGALIGRTGTQWLDEASRRDMPKQLFGTLWYEGELCFLFSSANQGKTILALQIAHAIAGGEVTILDLNPQVDPQKVLYFDFELSAAQFRVRYTENGKNPYSFNDNLIRYEISPEFDVPPYFKSFEDYLVNSIERAVKSTGSKIIVIDNLSFLSGDTERAKDASPLMKALKKLKSQYDLSMLILAHTPKRDTSKPLTQYDLQGSSRLMQFADSSIAIGQSVLSSDTKYLKQVKARNTEIQYDADNVLVFSIKKVVNFLQLALTGTSTEYKHLKTVSPEDRDHNIREAQNMFVRGASLGDISKALGLSKSTVRRYVNKNASEWTHVTSRSANGSPGAHASPGTSDTPGTPSTLGTSDTPGTPDTIWHA